MKVLFAILFVVVVAFAEKVWVDDPEVKLPSSFHICSRSDPQLNSCIKDNLIRITTELTVGFPSLGVPPYDPVKSKRNSFTFKQNNLLVVLHAKDTKAVGLSKAVVKDVKAKFTDNEAELKVSLFLPRIVVDGQYKGEGHYNALNFNSRGYFNMTFDDINNKMTIKGKTVERNGEIYMRMNSFDMKPTIGNLVIYATGMFPDPELNRVALDFINSRWRPVYKSLLPEYRSTWEPIMLESVNNIFLRVPYRRLLKN